MRPIEIMAPAGSLESLQAALQSGAHSVYFGVEQLNMRARASNNFRISDLPGIVSLCQSHNVKTYLTLNTVLYDYDLVLMRRICDAAKHRGVDAVIISDIAAMQYCRKIGMPVHISTQVNISNIEALQFFAQFADTVVLARELGLGQISSLCREIEKRNIRGPSGNLVRVEAFAHGALCVAIAGKCHMSLATYNASANRGACFQNCRRKYRVIDDEEGHELVIDNEYVMSPKDLCTIGALDQLLATGVTVLKIEGRGRGPEYVRTVVRCYREAIDAIHERAFSSDRIQKWVEDLASVYNRGFWHGGYYLGKEAEMWSGVYGSVATKEKVVAGVVENYYQHTGVVYVELDSHGLRVGDDVLIVGPTTGVVETAILELRQGDVSVDNAESGGFVTFKVPQKVRKNDKVYIFRARQEWQK